MLVHIGQGVALGAGLTGQAAEQRGKGGAQQKRTQRSPRAARMSAWSIEQTLSAGSARSIISCILAGPWARSPT